MPTPPEIIRQLTRAQRRVLVAVVEEEGCWRPVGQPGLFTIARQMFWVGTQRVRERTIYALENAGLLELDEWCADEAYDPTPLGLTVVKEIQKRQKPVRCSHEHQRVKRRFVVQAGQTMDLPEWVRCVLNEGHDGEHKYD